MVMPPRLSRLSQRIERPVSGRIRLGRDHPVPVPAQLARWLRLHKGDELAALGLGQPPLLPRPSMPTALNRASRSRTVWG
jgi:hypothetical protein